MYREKYCQKKAVEMFASGQTKKEVIEMLKAENAREAELATLAEKFYQDYEFLRKEKRRQRRKTAERDVLIGSVMLAAGLVLTLISYLSTGSGQYVLFTGIIIAGLIFLGKGTIEKMNLKKDTLPETLN